MEKIVLEKSVQTLVVYTTFLKNKTKRIGCVIDKSGNSHFLWADVVLFINGEKATIGNVVDFIATYANPAVSLIFEGGTVSSANFYD